MGDKLAAAGAELPAGESFGTWLRQQREMREIHLSEIADRTKISLRYLRAMEQDQFDLLPGPIFVKGFLREYAKYVGLNPDDVVNFYLSTRAELEETTGEEDDETHVSPRSRSRGLLWAIAGILLLAILSYAVFSYLNRRRESAIDTAPPFGPPAAQQPAATPADAASGDTRTQAPQAPAKPLTVTLDFSEDCWVEVVVDEGAERVDRRFVQGESLTLEAERSVVFQTLGNVGGVSLQVNGVPYPLAGGRDSVQRNLRIDLDTVHQLGGQSGRDDRT